MNAGLGPVPASSARGRRRQVRPRQGYRDFRKIKRILAPQERLLGLEDETKLLEAEARVT